MSYYVLNNEIFKDLDTTKLGSKLVFGDKIVSDNNVSKYYLYYTDKNETKEIYIRLPKTRMIFNNFYNQKYSTINIPIYPLWERTEEFINFITMFEEIISTAFKTKLVFNSLISIKKSLKLFKMSMKDKPKITSNLNKEITFNDFKINSEVELVVKVSYVWLSKKLNMYGLSCHLSQIKYCGTPEQSFIDFIDEPIIKPYIPPPPPMFNMSQIETGKKLNADDVFKRSLANSGFSIIPTISKIVPSMKDLADALKKLKKKQ